MRKKLLNECIVLAKKNKNGCYLAKNRDRTYSPTTQLVHGNYPYLEYVVLSDTDTGYFEGVNATTGIAALNSALLNGVDFGKAKSPEGYRMLKSLLYSSTIEEMVEKITKENKVFGCTVITDGTDICVVESDKNNCKHKIYTNPEEYVVRANHGKLLRKAGYDPSEADDYLSSKTREAVGEIIVHNSDSIDDVMSNFLYPFFDNMGAMNPTRSTDYMSTTCQLGIDMENKRFLITDIPGKQKFLGIKKIGPWKSKPTWKIETVDYKTPLRPSFKFWGTR